MNGILVIAHAPLASALRQCVLHVFPDAGPHVVALDVPPNQPPAETLAQAQQMIALQGAPHTLVLTDVGKDSHDGLTCINVVTVGQLERGAQWAYRIGSGNWTSGTGSQFSLPEGSHVLGNVRVRQTDDAGNTSAEGANSAPFIIDLTAPTAPQAMLAFYKPDGIARVSSQGTVNVAGLEPTATWAYMLIHLAN